MEYSTTFGNKGVDGLLKPRPQLKAMLKAVEDLVPVKSVLRVAGAMKRTVLLTLVGATREEILADYLLSNVAMHGDFIATGTATGSSTATTL